MGSHVVSKERAVFFLDAVDFSVTLIPDYQTAITTFHKTAVIDLSTVFVPQHLA
jgi:hypothetical protein